QRRRHRPVGNNLRGRLRLRPRVHRRELEHKLGAGIEHFKRRPIARRRRNAQRQAAGGHHAATGLEDHELLFGIDLGASPLGGHHRAGEIGVSGQHQHVGGAIGGRAVRLEIDVEHPIR
ncbi:MAG: hypothetical protein ACK559_29165, partial [bacterium]